MTRTFCFTPRLQTLACLVALTALSSSAVAQYKVVGPDGKVTYTDRPVSESNTRVSPMRGGTSATDVVLPIELRQASQRYPVTLFTMDNCEPCTAGKTLLRNRGVPYNERTVTTNEDAEALEKLVGSREAPVLTIGAQTLRGLSPESWNSYLDAAGYPRESHLPANYVYTAPAPMVERRAAATGEPATTVRRPAARPAPAPAPAPANPGIKF